MDGGEEAFCFRKDFEDVTRAMKFKRLISIIICIVLVVTIQEMSVLALGPDSEWTVAQIAPAAPENGPVIPDPPPQDEAPEPEPEVSLAATEVPEEEAQAPADSAPDAEAPLEAVETELPEAVETELPEAQPEAAEASTLETEAEAGGPIADGEVPQSEAADPVGAAPQAPALAAAAKISVEEILIVGKDALSVGESLPLSAVVLPEEATDPRVRWSSSDPAVVSVSEEGVVTALARGQAEITAAAQDGSGVRAALTLTTYVPAPEEVTNVPASLRIGVGQLAAIRWAVLPAYASQEVVFKTSNKKIADVTADGHVRGVKAGSCTVTVETPNGKSQTCKVEVANAPAALDLNISHIELGLDPEAGLYESFVVKPRISDKTATAFAYVSGDENIASVNEAGLITARGLGETTVTVRTHNGLEAVCRVTVLPLPQSVSIGGVLALSVGDTIRAEIAFEPENAVASVAYSSSNPNVMTVSADGRITGVATGAATLMARTSNGRTASRKVSVYPAPTGIVVDGSAITIGVGEQRALEAWVQPPEARTGFSYSSSQKKNVTVDANGTITGLRAGSANITISAYNGVKTTVKVTVKKAPGGVSLSESELTLGWDSHSRTGESFRLSAQISNGSAGACEFTSSDAWVARVDARTGEVTARGVGTAVITASAYNGASASCIVHVLEAAAGLEAERGSVTLGVGQSCGFGAVRIGGVSRLTYRSSDESVATVSANGTITARKAGKATITAATFNGYQAVMNVTVTSAPSSVGLAQKQVTIGVGAQYQIVPVIPDGTLASFTYKSSKAAVASVDENGLVTGMSAGAATITVKTHNGKSVLLTVTVIKAPTSISLNRTEISMQPTETVALKATLSKGSAASIFFSSSDESVAVVDAAGSVEAIGLGSCVITAVTNNGLTAECAIYVVSGPAAIRVPADMKLGTSEMVRPAVEILNADGKVYSDEYTLTSSNSAVVAVSGGTITGKKAGKATVTVRSHTITASFNVEVVKYAKLYPVQVIAHRGASAYVQDNTIEAFRLAHEMGADGIELDVRRTKDGELVIFHDASLEVDGARVRIADLTLEELQAIDLNGCTMPTLDQALDYLKTTGMTVQVELKEEGTGGDCADAVRRHGMNDQVFFISFSLPALNEVKYEDPSARIGYICRAVPTDVAKLAQLYDLYALLPRQAIVNEKLVNTVHAAGLKLGTWTINDAESVSQLSQMGVDYIATDLPDMALLNKN